MYTVPRTRLALPCHILLLVVFELADEEEAARDGDEEAADEYQNHCGEARVRKLCPAV